MTLDKQITDILESLVWHTEGERANYFVEAPFTVAKAALKRLIKEVGENLINDKETGKDIYFALTNWDKNPMTKGFAYELAKELQKVQCSRLKELLK